MYSCDPPVKIEWTKGVSLSEMLSVLRNLAENDGTVAAVNQITPQLYQLALAS